MYAILFLMSFISSITPNLEIEKKYWRQGIEFVAGVDEVGRGCLAGPVVVAAVIFSPDHIQSLEIKDSKLLSPAKRDKLFDFIYQNALDISVSLMTVDIIDQVNILEATKLAMIQAIETTSAEQALIDGRDVPDSQCSCQAIIKGDQKSYSIAAASIIAKVVRDALMTQLDYDFPNYDWAHNKGYGTKRHRQAILDHGPTVHHRAKFIRKILGHST